MGDDIKGIRIPIGHLTFHGVHLIDLDANPRAQVLKATAVILGTDFHVIGVRVQDEDGLQRVVCDPLNRSKEIYALNEGRLETITLPTFDGEWIIVIHPFGS